MKRAALALARGSDWLGILLGMPVVLAGGGCATQAWDVEAMEQRYPSLREYAGHRLAEARPYFLPLAGTLTLFFCRWPDAEVVPVGLPPDASLEERRKIEAALDAWGRVRLGVSLRAGAAGKGVEMRLFDDMLAQTANTVAECAVDLAQRPEAGPAPLPARLVFASIHMAHGDPRLAGTALHELGHALGLQGHPAGGRSVMVRRTRAVRQLSEQVLRGDDIDDPTVPALYALPSGAVVKRSRVSREKTAPVDALAAIAQRRGFAGPFLRAGDDEGRIAWIDSEDRWVSLRLLRLGAAMRDPARLEIVPSERARVLLEEAVGD